jgi:hypothetical protein
MRIESVQKFRFVGPHAGLNLLEGILVHKKQCLHRAVVTPEPHRAQRRSCFLDINIPPNRSQLYERSLFYVLVSPRLPPGWGTAFRDDAKGDAVGAALTLTLFLSAFGFFFSRLLRNWPFATSLSQGLSSDAPVRILPPTADSSAHVSSES